MEEKNQKKTNITNQQKKISLKDFKFYKKKEAHFTGALISRKRLKL